ncbi:FMN-dependent NADH-azoreductase [Stutzerimonas stutzeri]|uniref:FMN dependent NADH:quinone oxidoreductase n=1 Tax=Stutzerimonas stutzeri TaxID=316 RepID=W8R797_STUST|nr:NAD(P)H-dependent oxidoreductase [Stutzerimonas stutzeri]AHL75458.1 FMN-dependent NADH-azoreductase [Stutzerimonas stutzeri]MCQ4327973.1 NAD(P)H-dependent oxidoreductase [Stutzerimonas stutzeri]
MRELLLINASPRPAASVGSQLANELIDTLRNRRPDLRVTRRDLGVVALPPLSDAYANALTRRTPDTDPVFTVSEGLIGELERSDALLIATPMHNFTLPAALKLWIDHVVRIGRTFAATPDGKVGLLADRPVYVIVSSGGFHRGARARQPDFLTAYLRHVLSTIGLFDVHFVYLEGLVAGEETVKAECEAARQRLFMEPLFASLVST